MTAPEPRVQVIEDAILQSASTDTEAVLAMAGRAIAPTDDVGEALRQADVLEERLDRFDMVVVRRADLAMNRRAELTDVGRKVREQMLIGLEDVYLADDEADRELWLERIGEWADHIHAKYAEVLKSRFPPLEARRA